MTRAEGVKLFVPLLSLATMTDQWGTGHLSMPRKQERPGGDYFHEPVDGGTRGTTIDGGAGQQTGKRKEAGGCLRSARPREVEGGRGWPKSTTDAAAGDGEGADGELD